jgi:hypothetical protein
MLRIEFNGKPFEPDALEDALMAAALEAAKEQIREKIGGIRDPQTGEFPTVVIRATSLEDMQLHIEGSDALIARVREALGVDHDGEQPVEGGPEATSLDQDPPRTPKVFLSYASEDRDLARQLAHALIRNGIDTWWDRWEIRAGDSLRQKIDAGLEDCTHFLVLLTPVSLSKPWVNQEIDAGLVRMLSERIGFLPVRCGLAVSALPPLLRGRHSPEIRDLETDLHQLIQDIHGVTRKPPIGPPPSTASQARKSGASPAAVALARAFVEHTKTATQLDPQFTKSQLQAMTGLSREDLADAIYELRGVVKVHEYSGGGFVVAEPELYADFDTLWKPWNPAEDALRLAADLHNDPDFPTTPAEIADRYDYPPRRLNPALAYLIARDLVEVLVGIGNADYLCHRVTATDATRRFVKSRSSR